MSTLYHFCIQIANISMRKAYFKANLQENVPANNCHLKVVSDHRPLSESIQCIKLRSVCWVLTRIVKWNWLIPVTSNDAAECDVDSNCYD